MRGVNSGTAVQKYRVTGAVTDQRVPFRLPDPHQHGEPDGGPNFTAVEGIPPRMGPIGPPLIIMTG
jgi:hypothetical protein